MEHISTWVGLVVALLTVVILPLVNTLITKKIDNLETKQKEDRDLYFQRLDIVKDTYVRKDMYQQAMEFHQKETDSKFNNLVSSMNKQFENVEEKIQNVDGKIDDIKDLINDKFNKGGNTNINNH